MARGLRLCSHGGPASVLLSSSVAKFSVPLPTCQSKCVIRPFRSCGVCLARFSCECARAQGEVDLAQYQELFSKRMAMAGLKPHHRVAIGVSGGPDSMALCVLAANWKTEGKFAAKKSNGFIDGLQAIIVDHGLRTESKDEAELVSYRVSQMGIRCEIVRCDWVGGKPKLGHLQEAAREMRYQKLQNVCIQQRIGVVLIAHHADDQAELFILRLSRSSGVLGLACMAFTSEIFSSGLHSDGNLRSHGILVVRPLLDFWKEDMYKICQHGNQDWVEDPTNLNQSFARNRIRMSIGGLPSSVFKPELQAVISACRRTRAFVDFICSNLLDQSVTIMDQQGYAVVDLGNLKPSKIPDICLSKYVALILQFISQRQRPIRGSTLKLLIQYMRTIPCKTSLTAAGCYLCPVPGSKGTKALVCHSVDCVMPAKTEVFYTCFNEDPKSHILNEEVEVMANAKSFSDQFIPDASEVRFLEIKSGSILSEAKKLHILNESTYRDILLLQREETNCFKSKIKLPPNNESEDEVEMASASPQSPRIGPGQICYLRNRFLISWKPNKLNGECHCGSCVVSHDMVVEVRHMIESDWLYLAKLAKSPSFGTSQPERNLVGETGQMEQLVLCSDFLRLSAQRALLSLKTIPVAVRRSLPVLVNPHGLLLNIPTIGFKHCPCLDVTAEFRPRVPLGGGHRSFI